MTMTAQELLALDPASAASVIESWLPPVRELPVMSEVHYYGAAHLIAKAIGLDEPPPVEGVAWHHGPNLPPLWGLGELDPRIPPEEMDYPFSSASPTAVRLLVQRKEEAFFQSLGCTRYIAVGTPFIYVPPMGLKRIAGMLLAMPSHSFVGGVGHQHIESVRRYAQYLAGLRAHYPFVAVCLYGDDYKDQATRAVYESANLPILRGAAINDMNSLRRMRALFELFDCMTSNDIGSHAFYASATGCRVFLSDHSLFGEKEAIWSQHCFYQKRPHVMRNVLRWIDPVWLRAQWPWLYQGPGNPSASKSWADEFLGTANRRSPEEIASLLGWRYPFDLPESHERFHRLAPRLGWEPVNNGGFESAKRESSDRSDTAEGDRERAAREMSDQKQSLEAEVERARRELSGMKHSLAWKLAGKHLFSIEKRVRRLCRRED
jgi:hypothetical protein